MANRITSTITFVTPAKAIAGVVVGVVVMAGAVMAILIHVKAANLFMTPPQAVAYVVATAKSQDLHSQTAAGHALYSVCLFWGHESDLDFPDDWYQDLPMLRRVASHSVCRQHA